MSALRHTLVARVSTFMHASLSGDPHESFDALALDIHRFQIDADPVLQALAEQPASSVDTLPAVPVDLFKELPVGTVRADEPSVTFLTSGTTQNRRGSHRVRDTALYDQGSLAWAARHLPTALPHIIGLLGDPVAVPESSLSHMVSLFPQLGPAGTDLSWHVHAGVLDVAGLHSRLRSLHGPALLCTTAFALDEWLRSDPLPLPPGSAVMVTGGFKGRVHSLSGDDLLAAADTRLGHPTVVTEYGMTELCSQLWGTPASAYSPPPWLRVLAVDPYTGQVLPTGRHGQLRFVDLANVDSTLAIDTLDAGVVQPDGAVMLAGRLQGAPARGCSLTVEEAWLKQR